MSLLACIADDYTGATDVASALRRGGLRTVLAFGPPAVDWPLPVCDAVVVGLKSRSLPAAEAVEVSQAARRWLARHRPTQTYFKYCSTFDSTDEGNIGPVADALMASLGSDLTIVCPAAPEHGRTVYQGHLFVGDRLLSESGMRDHPLTPMRDADLVGLLGRQTHHEVALVGHEVVRQGPDAVAKVLADMTARGVRYAVTDAVSDEDLRTIACAGRALPLLTGAAGLARAVAEVTRTTSGPHLDDDVALPTGPAVILAGSASTATRAQVDLARTRYPTFVLDPAMPDVTDRAIDWLDGHLGDAPLLMHAAAPASGGSDAHLGKPRAAEVVEAALGALARHAVQRGARRIVVAGGESSGAVTTALGVTSVIVGPEEDHGVPWLITTQEPRLGLILKSGNFGRPDLLVRAAERRA